MYQKKTCINRLSAEFRAISANESLARSLVCAFVTQLSPTVGELADIRCAVSEAVTNAIVHGYRDADAKKALVSVKVWLYDNRSMRLVISDKGIGIQDIDQARMPLFTTDETGERSGMGFSIMESFMNQVTVRSAPGKGTTVVMNKRLGVHDAAAEAHGAD